MGGIRLPNGCVLGMRPRWRQGSRISRPHGGSSATTCEVGLSCDVDRPRTARPGRPDTGSGGHDRSPQEGERRSSRGSISSVNRSSAESLWRLGPVRRGHRDSPRQGKRFLDARGETGVNSTVTAELASFLAETGQFDEAAALDRGGPFDGSAGRLRDLCSRSRGRPAALALARGDPEAALAATSGADRGALPRRTT